MGFYYLILTSASVSVDSFVAGMAIGADRTTEKQKIAAYVMCMVAILCAAAGIASEFITDAMAKYAVKIGGCILILIGICGALKKEETTDFAQKTGITTKAPLLIGLGVGADGACACFSFILMGYDVWSVIMVTAFHYLFLELGIALANNKILSKIKDIKLSCFLLMILGIYKLF